MFDYITDVESIQPHVRHNWVILYIIMIVVVHKQYLLLLEYPHHSFLRLQPTFPRI